MKLIVGISDMKIGTKPEEELVTYSLGSCIGVVLWDPVVKVGALLHYMLPDSSIDKDKAEMKPFMFADTGVPRMFKEIYKHGGVKERMKVYIVGGAQIMDDSGMFNIGKRNQMIIRKMFWKNNVTVAKEDVGGSVNRTVTLNVGTGHVRLKISGQGEVDL
ncbi:MAG: chemotaxis protein CheD [Proteobacteria bacterium]|nr:chemotaxis protein CheD [Desulfobulbaceae bacterium]MBU4153183.1 chemotaxis protein CheD [Pseudomonadota bacterium]MDP2106440.1 chemotaxis protein CheD [Desulfobulbaceae bacterium]